MEMKVAERGGEGAKESKNADEQRERESARETGGDASDSGGAGRVSIGE